MQLFKKKCKRNTLITAYSNNLYNVAGLINGGGGSLYPGGLISGVIYSLANGWAYIQGRLKRGGGFKVGFYGIYLHVTSASRVSISVCSFIIIF